MSVADVNQWLFRCYGFRFPLDWLEACCAWLMEESGGSRLSQDEIRSQVLSQWLVSDLREVGATSLPASLSDQVKVTVEGCHCVQVNAVYDVSCSFYSQLQKAQGTENENVKVTATQNSQVSESGRMLMFEMTDGTQSIRGMEYQPLIGVNDSLTPGVKVVIKGPVTCRHGVLMLTSENFIVLGGEVDSLAGNTKLTVLQKALENNKNQENFDRKRQTLSVTYDNSNDRRTKSGTSDTSDEGSIRDSVEHLLVGVDPSDLDSWDDLTEMSDIRTKKPTDHNYGNNHMIKKPKKPSFHGNEKEQKQVHVPAPASSVCDIPWHDEDDDDFEVIIQSLEELDKIPEDILTVEETNRQQDGSVSEPLTADANTSHFKQTDESQPPQANYSLNTKPFTYLALVRNYLDNADESVLVQVKAYVSTLLGRLENNGGSFWSLAVKLNDGTASIDVNLGDDLLSSMIGFSASECNLLKQRAKLCEHTRKKIVHGIKHCQQSLVQLYGLITLELIPGHSLPLAVSCSPLTDTEVNVLRHRLL